MSIFHLRQIEAALRKRFEATINADDIAMDDPRRPLMILSRSVAAFTVSFLTGCQDQQAGDSVTDGFGDEGIDAIYYDRLTSRLVLVQSKWSQTGKGGVPVSDVTKFIDGATKLLHLDFSNFNAKVLAKQDTIEEAMYRADTQLHLVYVYNGTQNPSERSKTKVKKWLDGLNDSREFASFQWISQAELHAAVARGIEAKPIDLRITVHDWGLVREPFQAYYGRIRATDVATWWEEHHNGLFDRNIRKLITDSSINLQIEDTARRLPEQFWYMNNGITLLCTSIVQAPAGASSRTMAILECEGASVVNGAQTVGTIGRVASTKSPNFDNAWVAVRLISLQDAPEELATAITKANNTQNRIDRRDFAALDPHQKRLANEFQLDDRTYVFKTGDTSPPPESGCTIEEATIALACSHPDLALTVRAKSGVGALWDDSRDGSYRKLFTRHTNADQVWTRVDVLRRVEERLQSLRQSRNTSGLDFSAKQVVVHGNRFVLRQVFRVLDKTDVNPASVDLHQLTLDIVLTVAECAETVWAGEPYMAWAFKTRRKCENLEASVSAILLSGSPAIGTAKHNKIRLDPTGQTSFPFPGVTH